MSFVCVFVCLCIELLRQTTAHSVHSTNSIVASKRNEYLYPPNQCSNGISRTQQRNPIPFESPRYSSNYLLYNLVFLCNNYRFHFYQLWWWWRDDSSHVVSVFLSFSAFVSGSACRLHCHTGARLLRLVWCHPFFSSFSCRFIRGDVVLFLMKLEFQLGNI